MLRKIIVAFKNFFVLQENRMTERQARKNYHNTRENLTNSNLLMIEDKLNILDKKFKDLKYRITLNGNARFTHEQIYEFSMYKRELNKLQALKKYEEFNDNHDY